jgi:hypothetical protein
MNRLRKFVERGAYSEGPLRTAYVFDLNSLPESGEGNQWIPDDKFSPADELLNDPDLKAVFKLAIENGCAFVKLKAEK